VLALLFLGFAWRVGTATPRASSSKRARRFASVLIVLGVLFLASAVVKHAKDPRSGMGEAYAGAGALALGLATRKRT